MSACVREKELCTEQACFIASCFTYAKPDLPPLNRKPDGNKIIHKIMIFYAQSVSHTTTDCSMRPIIMILRYNLLCGKYGKSYRRQEMAGHTHTHIHTHLPTISQRQNVNTGAAEMDGKNAQTRKIKWNKSTA